MRQRRSFEDNAFLVLLIAVSLAFAWVLWPFSGAVLWATTLAIIFAPIYRRLVVLLGRRRSLAALATLSIILLLVILPLTMIIAALVQEASGLYQSFQSGEINLASYFQQMRDALPHWAASLLDRSGLSDLGAWQERVSAGLLQASQYLAAQAVSIGQMTFEFVVSLFVMVYLLFFLLRDGDRLVDRIEDAVPLHAEHRRAFFDRFTVAIRATVKGDVVIALLQGALGGLMFWLLGIRAALLWAALMAVLSLFPVLGSGLVWGPVAIYFLLAGPFWKGVVLLVYGVLVIGLVDNLVRPALVAKDTRMPDYVVLISTLGAIAMIGLNGFVIGPVIAALFIAAWDIFAKSHGSDAQDG